MDDIFKVHSKPKIPALYGDGASLTHYQGNDEYPNGANLPDLEFLDIELLEGKIAFGNEELPEEEENDFRDLLIWS